MGIKIIIVDDHPILREGLRALLKHHPDMDVVAEAGDGRMAVRLVLKMLPDVVLMDIAMPLLNGIEATRQIVTSAPQVKVIGLSMYSDRRVAVQMLKAGAKGYLLKDDSTMAELERGIKTVLSNRIYLSPKVGSIVIQDYLSRVPDGEDIVFGILSAREREVLQLIVEGRATNEIASFLSVSRKTVETHRRNIMAKLDIQTTAELISWAVKNRFR